MRDAFVTGLWRGQWEVLHGARAGVSGLLPLSAAPDRMPDSGNPLYPSLYPATLLLGSNGVVLRPRIAGRSDHPMFADVIQLLPINRNNMFAVSCGM